ncbi:hypothetical protein CSC70_00550 [Pseudoxanthomonas kalamensis DSM 18571]|uniref:L,D-transpeptidase n=1 Tax=Pseudoxanthomonas kalamensis TaxID=289483 RepID=UPI00139191EA|nr:L,D-transpeptidase [Pseudoxanthomonas kalamensis]KAF1712057.1 hypothetical protein CSC70_00550 [Pseudoxanthomonas kalamensis DSM 18571]
MCHTSRLALSLLMLVLTGTAFAQDAASPVPVDTPDPLALKPGEFLWHPEIAPQGPIVLVVSLDEQLAYVYRNGMVIGVSTISSGKKGKETPTGVFTILQKNKDHRSNLYDSAPMPYMQRLTWDGIALHAGNLPGYPASHGCVRLPMAFAQELFSVTRNGDTVVVADAKAGAASVAHPAVLAPVDGSGQIAGTEIGQVSYWNPDASPEGPLGVLVSLADQRVYVLRNGARIGEASLRVEDDFRIGGSILMVMGSETEDGPSLLDPSQPRRRWAAYPILGADAKPLAMLQLQLREHPLQVDAAFTRQLYPMLVPGTTVLLTDLPATRMPADGTRELQPVLKAEPSVGTNPR